MVLRVFVVTNHRFTEEFREALSTKTFNATPIDLECESIDLQAEPAEKKTFVIISESIDMTGGTFTCIGHTDAQNYFRLEEEMGTLVLYVAQA